MRLLLAALTMFAPLGQPGPPLTVPQAKLQASLKCTANVKDAKREPVLLESATGVTSEQNYSWNYERAFRQQGIPYCTTDQPGQNATNLGDIQVRGQYIVHAIRRMHALSGRRIAVMGHSQGGMVMRWALRFWPDTRAMVEDVVGMAGSNHGAGDGDGTGEDAPANLQQGGKSRFTAALNSGAETFAGIDYTEIYTIHDEVVTPNADDSGSSSVHGPGRITNVAVQDICPADPSEHLIIGTMDNTAYALFMDALTHDGPADVSRIPASVCAAPFQPGFDPVTGPASAATAAAALETNENDYPTVSREPPLACYVTATCPGVPRCQAARVIRVRVKGRRVRVDLRRYRGRVVKLRVRGRRLTFALCA